MKKLTFILLAMVFGMVSIQASEETDQKAEQLKREAAPTLRTAAIYNELPDGYVSLGDGSKVYYSVGTHYSVITGTHETINILGEIDGKYYSSTYNDAGYLMAMQVNGGTASYIDCVNGSTSRGVAATARIEPQGEVAAKITISLTNENADAVTVNVGMYGDVWIGTNDYAPIYRMNNAEGETYGLRMKQTSAEDSPLFCALFGEGVTGVTPVDDFWFGRFASNYSAGEIVGAYTQSTDWMVEGGNYDSAIGFCWKNRPIQAGETVEFSFVVSVGDVDFEEPITPDEPGQDIFTYDVVVEDIEAWNDLAVAHPAYIMGHYEHPYGQEGYIEYQVDGGEWIRIPTPLTSGEDYNLPFDIFFNQGITTIHTLNLRFTLGLGSYTDLEGLEWVDVRSYVVEDAVPSFPYDGNPKIFVVTVNGMPVVIGDNDEYVNPGTYTVVVAEGNYNENTIGIQTITFVIENTTAVEEISVSNEDNGAWYTVDGCRVAAPTQRGIYIHNGKKYIVK
ncbi:MAG: hypothetical protein IJV11_12650 [Muribaculaceae bacterium]|nr:hypothetical protein [Muribaculaceae bacterium]